MFKDTVTVFNFSNGSWFPTVIKNAELQIKSGVKENNSGVLSSDNALLFVSCKGDIVGGKSYLPPKAWQRFDVKESTVTFAEDDFFVIGEFLTIANDEDYEDGYFAYMTENLDNCYKITSIKKLKGIPHFEIGGA